MRDSGVGVDTLLYSCWKYAHDGARESLYSFYLHLFDVPLEDEENELIDSRLVFIQKGRIEPQQAGVLRRSPGKTRPSFPTCFLLCSRFSVLHVYVLYKVGVLRANR